MGLALDEPQDGDEKHEIEGIEVYLDKWATRVDAIKIHYTEHPYYGGFSVSTGESSDSCSC
jgi:Fe-S cluster assembly iron-binding protein IscA